MTAASDAAGVAKAEAAYKAQQANPERRVYQSVSEAQAAYAATTPTGTPTDKAFRAEYAAEHPTAAATPAQAAAAAAKPATVPPPTYQTPPPAASPISLSDIRTEATLADQQYVAQSTGLPLATVQARWDELKGKTGGYSYGQLTEKGIKEAEETGKGYIGGLGYDLTIRKEGGADFGSSRVSPRAEKEIVGGVSLSSGVTVDYVRSVDNKIQKTLDKVSGYSTYEGAKSFKPELASVSTVPKESIIGQRQGVEVEYNLPIPKKEATQDIFYYDVPNTEGKLKIPYATGNESVATMIGKDIDRATEDFNAKIQKNDYELYKNATNINPKHAQDYYNSLQMSEGALKIGSGIVADFAKSALFVVPAASATALAASRLIQQTVNPSYEPRTQEQIEIEKRIFEVEKPSYILGTFSFPLTYEALPKAAVGAIGFGTSYAGEKLVQSGVTKYLANTGVQGFTKAAIENKYILKESGKLLATSIIAAGGISAGLSTDETGKMNFNVYRAAGGAVATAGLLYATTKTLPEAGNYLFENAPVLKNVNNPFVQSKIVPIKEARKMQQAYPELTEAKLKEGSQAVKDMVAEAKAQNFRAQFEITQNEYNERLGNKQIANLKNEIAKNEKFIQSVTKPMIDKEAMEAARSDYIKKLMRPINAAEIGKPMKPYVSPEMPKQTVGKGLMAGIATTNLNLRVSGMTATYPKLSGMARIKSDIKAASLRASAIPIQSRTNLKTSTRTSTILRQMNVPSMAQITSQILIQPTLKAQAQTQTSAQTQARINALTQTQSQIQTQTQTRINTRLLTRLKNPPSTIAIPKLNFPQNGKIKKFKQSKRSKQKFGYAPSFTASVFGITGKVASDVLSGKRVLTGFEFRPIPSRTGVNRARTSKQPKGGTSIRKLTGSGLKGKFKRFKGFKL